MAIFKIWDWWERVLPGLGAKDKDGVLKHKGCGLRTTSCVGG